MPAAPARPRRAPNRGGACARLLDDDRARRLARPDRRSHEGIRSAERQDDPDGSLRRSRGGGQAMDVWILDTQTGELAQVPGMPAVVDLKFTSMEWTRDGRLVFPVQWNGKSLVAVWRPGDAKLQ